MHNNIEYLESGRCDTLTGPYGAYNKYDGELLAKIIIGELHEINRHLDQIERNQRTLADAIRQSTYTTNQVIGSVQNTLGGIQECVAYSAYYDKVTATNTAYLAWMRTFNK